jgi:AraC family transcriptional regulator
MRDVTRSFYEQVVERAIEHVASHLDEALDLEAIAAAAGLSPFHFHRIFRGMVGETPLELGRRLRLERAALWLRRGDRAVTAIAFEAGYETHEGFTRAFRASYGTSPSGFRERSYPRIELAASSGVHFDERGLVSPFTPRQPRGDAMHVDLEHRPELRAACVRHVGPYNQIPEAFGRLDAIIAQSGLIPREGESMLAIYHDDPDAVPVEQLRADACVVVTEDAELPASLEERRIAAGRYARARHIGPYELLGDSWVRFMGEWLPASGHRIGTGVSYELYRNMPGMVPREQLHTDLYLPIAETTDGEG